MKIREARLTEKGCALLALHEAQIERFWKLFTEARARSEGRRWRR